MTDTDQVPVFVQDPAVDIAKNVAPPGGAVNGIITFTIQITNVGPSTLDVIPLVDRFTGPMAYIRGTPVPDSIDNSGQILMWDDLTQPPPHGLGRDLGPDESFVITTVFQLIEMLGTFTVSNTATVANAVDVHGNPASDDQDDVALINIPTAVELLFFRATPQPAAVLLEWETAVEVDSYGFAILRSTTGRPDDAQEIAFVAAAGYGAGRGATYSYPDLTAQPGSLCTYWLVDVDTQGQRTVHGPVTVTALPQMALPYRVYLPFITWH